MGRHGITARTGSLERSSGFFAACSARVESACTTSCFPVSWSAVSATVASVSCLSASTSSCRDAPCCPEIKSNAALIVPTCEPRFRFATELFAMCKWIAGRSPACMSSSARGNP